MVVRVGTASWTDPTLIKCKCFYPPEANTAEERLRFYASRFNVVEVDSSYYAMPSVDNAILWARRTPRDFKFDVKVFRAFTLHPTPGVPGIVEARGSFSLDVDSGERVS